MCVYGKLQGFCPSTIFGIFNPRKSCGQVDNFFFFFFFFFGGGGGGLKTIFGIGCIYSEE